MFFHIIKYRLLLTFRDKQNLSWLILFPTLLAFFFSIAFSNILTGETFQKIDVAIIHQESDEQFVAMLKATELCNITVTSEDTAQKLLNEGEVNGIIDVQQPMTLLVTQNGIQQSILKTVLDSYKQVTSTINRVVAQNPEILKTNFLNELNVRQSFTKEKPIGTATNVTVVFFYALLAMSSLMGATQAITDIEMIQADQSATAARVNVAPTHKLKMLTASLLCSTVLQFIIVLLSIAFMRFVLGVAFGDAIGYIVLLVFAGCFAGVMLGAMMSSFIKKTGLKIGVIIALTQLGSFLSGLMTVNMKYWVQQAAPFLCYVNPINLMTDGLYSLYYYGINERYFLNVILLFAFGVVGCAITYFKVKGKTYANL